MPWSRPFDEPIKPPKGKPLVTLKDAADYIMKLPKAEQNLEEWQTATSCLIMAAEDRGPLMQSSFHTLFCWRFRSRRFGITFSAPRTASGRFMHSCQGWPRISTEGR